MSTSVADRQTVVLAAIVVEGGLILLAWLVGWLLGHGPLEQFAWDGRDALWGLAATLPMAGLFLAMIRWPLGPLAEIKRFTEEIIRPALAECTLVDLFGISVLAGLGEEMLFRGVLQAAFSDWTESALFGILLAGVLFGVLHAITPTYAVLATLFGAYLGWVFLATGNLLVAVLAHALYDFLVLLYLLHGPGSRAALDALLREEEDPPVSDAS